MASGNINTCELFYQCSKHGPDLLFGKSEIKDFNDEPHFPERIKLISSQIEMNKLFKTNYERKIRRCDKSIHKAKIIIFHIHKDNKQLSVTVQPKMHVNWNLRIIYGYHFLTNHSMTL